MTVRNLLKISFLSFVLISLMSSSCDNDPAPETAAVTPEMDMLSYDFEVDFEYMWNKVDSLQQIGLYKSA